LPQALYLTTLVLGSYALGSIVGAYYLVRWRTGRDLRSLGSGNAGARNAGRVLGSAAFTATVLIDAGKGALATWIGLQATPQPLATVLTMLAVVVGHIWPVQLHFRGGKGAATALGIMAVFDPVAMAILLAIGAVVLLVTRRFTISGLVAIALTPLVAAWRGHTLTEVIALIIMAALILYAHRTNLLEYRSGIRKLSPTGNQEAAR
jgi:acyl phosphate:glycerol-3-phosphate acyltransferase